MESLIPDEHGIARGVGLFTYLVEAANHGKALGISYGDFLPYLHGASSFRDLAGRNFLNAVDIPVILAAAERVTAKAGRKKVERSGQSIDSGMDTFIWQKSPPFTRSPAAWRGSRFTIPYSREQWLRVFPDGARRLVTIWELEETLGRHAAPAPAVTRRPSRLAERTIDPPAPPLARKVPLSASEVSDFRRRLVHLIARLESEGNRPVRDGIGARIHQLSFDGVIPRETAAVMRTITEMRNMTEYEAKTLSLTQSALVEAAWAAIEEWATNRKLAL